MTVTHHDDVVRQFSRQAEGFAACPAHADERSLAVFFVLGGFASSDRLLDSGCGPGIVSRYLAHRVRRVTGVDVTRAMIGIARREAAAEGLVNTEFLEGNMASLPFESGGFDGAVTRYTFHHLETPLEALREMVRVTRPGGRVVVVDAVPPAAQRDAYDRFERQRDPSHTIALTMEELLALGERLGLGAATVERFRLPIRASDLLAQSHPEEVSWERLRAVLEADEGVDRLGFTPISENAELVVRFPIAAVAWQVPG
jgi:ubiquinone/menaquinone biosynthesis C-methylase UbiE